MSISSILRKFRETRINVRIYSSFSVLLLILLFVGLSGLYTIQLLNRRDNEICKTIVPNAFYALEMRTASYEVQQFLTDVAATKMDEGYEDAKHWREIYKENSKRLRESSTGDVKTLKLIDEADATFDRLYEVGVKMADIYVKKGTEAGNVLMKEKGGFDELSDRLGELGEELKKEKTSDLTAKTDLNYKQTTQLAEIIVAILVFGFVSGSFMAITIARSITIPIKMLELASDRIAVGDLTVTFSQKMLENRDEIGTLSRSFHSMTEQVRTMISEVNRNVLILMNSSEKLTEVSRRLGRSTEETSLQANTVAAASEEISQNISTISLASNEMNSSIKEIAKNSTDAVNAATNTTRTIQTANEIITKLGQSSVDIEEVVEFITAIAQQTNLLALNATIEAARAGEAGKGFAVVAHEVKSLAKETAAATESISNKIMAIRTHAKEAADSIAQIESNISEINQIQHSNAGAVEEQSATTLETSRNLAEAARVSAEITQSITGVAMAAADTSTAAADTLSTADGLIKLSDDLKQLVGRFKLS